MSDSTIGNCKVRVCVRVRPPNEDFGDVNCQTVEIEDKKVHFSDKFFDSRGGMKAMSFDYCAIATTSQKELFEKSGAKEILHTVIAGYSASILAYGQTGTGKTYTLLGDDQNKGLLSRLCDTLLIFTEKIGPIMRLQQVSSLSTETCLDRCVDCYPFLDISCVEIFNEALIDLMDHSPLDPVSGKVEWMGSMDTKAAQLNSRSASQKKLRLLKSQIARNRFDVIGDHNTRCFTPQDVDDCIKHSQNRRQTRSNLINESSSRSHCVFTVKPGLISNNGARGILTNSDVKHGDGEVVMFGKLIVVDLAGSERLKYSGSNDLSEMTNINKSLLALEKVICSLSRNAKDSHVPFRDSQITKILAESLGGSGLAMIIAAISPDRSFIHETLRTLKYAKMCMGITNKMERCNVVLRPTSTTKQKDGGEIADNTQPSSPTGTIDSSRSNQARGGSSATASQYSIEEVKNSTNTGSGRNGTNTDCKSGAIANQDRKTGRTKHHSRQNGSRIPYTATDKGENNPETKIERTAQLAQTRSHVDWRTRLPVEIENFEFSGDEEGFVF